MRAKLLQIRAQLVRVRISRPLHFPVRKCGQPGKLLQTSTQVKPGDFLVLEKLGFGPRCYQWSPCVDGLQILGSTGVDSPKETEEVAHNATLPSTDVLSLGLYQSFLQSCHTPGGSHAHGKLPEASRTGANNQSSLLWMKGPDVAICRSRTFQP